MTESNSKFPVLERPPILEVVCGIHFDVLEQLDPLTLGVYWDRRKGDYPGKSLQPAVSDNPQFILGTPPMRAILVGDNNVHVVQVQHDRLILNWRALGEVYPRFSSPDGLLSQALTEFGELTEFCRERFGLVPRATKVELTKIDHFERSKHWTDLADLQQVLPTVTTLLKLHQGDQPELALRILDKHPKHSWTLSIATVTDHPGGPIQAVRVEVRAVELIEKTEVGEAFVAANRSVNQTFFALLTREALQRFGAKEA